MGRSNKTKKRLKKVVHKYYNIRINNFLKTDSTIKINHKKQGRFDRSTVIFMRLYNQL